MSAGRLIIEYRGNGTVTRLERDVAPERMLLWDKPTREDLANVLASAGNELLRSAIPAPESETT